MERNSFPVLTKDSIKKKNGKPVIIKFTREDQGYNDFELTLTDRSVLPTLNLEGCNKLR